MEFGFKRTRLLDSRRKDWAYRTAFSPTTVPLIYLHVIMTLYKISYRYLLLTYLRPVLTGSIFVATDIVWRTLERVILNEDAK